MGVGSASPSGENLSVWQGGFRLLVRTPSLPLRPKACLSVETGMEGNGGGEERNEKIPKDREAKGLLNEPQKILAPTHVQCPVY